MQAKKKKNVYQVKFKLNTSNIDDSQKKFNPGNQIRENRNINNEHTQLNFQKKI